MATPEFVWEWKTALEMLSSPLEILPSIEKVSSRRLSGALHGRQPEASAAECESNHQRGGDPYGMSDGRNERNIDKPFAVHAAGEETSDERGKNRHRENAQGKQDCLRKKEPAMNA
jgi:hypothetical protein